MESKRTIGMIAIVLVAAIMTGFLLGVLVSKKPSITGKVVDGKETIFKENLNIVKNESGTYEWNVKNPGNIKSLKVTGSVSSNGSAKVYVEKNGTKLLLFDSGKQLFDVNINVLPDYKKIKQGDKVLIQITLLNLRGFGSGNVRVSYSIKDSDDNLIATQEESVFVETQSKFVRELVLPSEIKPGTYLAFVDAFTGTNRVGAGSDTFEVQSVYSYKYAFPLKYYAIGASVLLIVIVALLLGVYKFNIFKKHKKIAEIKEKEPFEKVAKLAQELKAIEEAHQSKFISEESYTKGKDRIEHEIERLKK